MIGSLCGLGCFTGYRLVNGDSFRECRQDGTWSGHQPKCEGQLIHQLHASNLFFVVEIRCSALKIHPRVLQECTPAQDQTTKFRFGTTCRAKCNATGYRLVGPRSRECLSTGKWTGYEQFCIGKHILTLKSRIITYFLQWVSRQHRAQSSVHHRLFAQLPLHQNT